MRLLRDLRFSFGFRRVTGNMTIILNGLRQGHIETSASDFAFQNLDLDFDHALNLITSHIIWT